VKPARILNQASSLSDEPERTPDDSPFCVPSFLSPPLCLLSPSVPNEWELISSSRSWAAAPSAVSTTARVYPALIANSSRLDG
jgi:hypothetical protein